MDWSECLDTNISYLNTINDKIEVITDDNKMYVIKQNTDYNYDLLLPNKTIKKVESYEIPDEINGEVAQINVYNNGQVTTYRENGDDGWYNGIYKIIIWEQNTTQIHILYQNVQFV
jgi:hypothetical protein